MVKKNNPNSRLSLLQAGFVIVSFLIVSKLFYIQVLKNKEYKARADEQHWSSRILSARRGDILASDGFPLATSTVSYLMFADPKKVPDPKALAKLLSENLYPDKEKAGEVQKNFEELLSRDSYWVMLERGLTFDQKNRVEELKQKGVGFEEQYQRYYPEKTLASQALGFVAGSETEEARGYFGLEGYFNGDLRGKPGKVFEELGAFGDTIVLGGFRKIPSVDGSDIVLTINREIQFLIEQKLAEGVEKYGAVSGSVVVMRSGDGEVLAMANYPTYDPADLTNGSNEQKESTETARIQRRNVAISDVYEPGSIIKPLTISAAVDTGLMTEDTKFVDDGPKIYSGHRVDNWDGKHHGEQNIRQLLEKSNNIGAAWVGSKVGAKTLYSYFKKFGLGENTGITLEGESTGIIRDYSQWRDIDVATASFGQGISASVLQIANAFSVFANGGVLFEPRIVEKIVEGDREIKFTTEEKRRVVSEDTARTIERLLISAVDNGEARYFNIKGYTVAGKTGTAQIPVEGKYDPSKTNATFVGFLPNVRDGKKFVMVVKLEEPTSSVFAAETAVPLWMDILNELVALLKIPPDRL